MGCSFFSAATTLSRALSGLVRPGSVGFGAFFTPLEATAAFARSNTTTGTFFVWLAIA